MSAPIRRIDTENRERAAVVTPAPAVKQKSRSTPLVSEANIAEDLAQPSTSYSAMLREAYDGDMSEAMAVVGQARRTGEPGTSPHSDTVAGLPHEKTAASKALPIRRGGKSAQVLEELRSRKQASAVASGSPVASGGRRASAKRSHDQLMLVSSKMGVSEIATHVSLQAFLSLTRILSGRNWLRQNGGFEVLLRAQSAQTAATR